MMQVGKPAMAMRRTTSMTGITVVVDPPPPSDPTAAAGPAHNTTHHQLMENHYLASMVSPRNNINTNINHHHHHMRSLSMESSTFLRTCGLCQRRLAPSNDIYMYRGDTAFCSQECREEQMKKDARKEKSLQRSKLAKSSSAPMTATNINRDDILTIGGSTCHPSSSSAVPTSTS